MTSPSGLDIVFSQYAQDPYEDFNEMLRRERENTNRVAKEKKTRLRRKDAVAKPNSTRSFVMSRHQRRGLKLIKISVIDLCNNSPGSDSDNESDNVIITAPPAKDPKADNPAKIGIKGKSPPVFGIVPKVEIVDERGRPLQDKFYKEGSIIELRCVVSEVPQPTRQVNWKHGSRLLNYDTKRGGVSVKTEATSNGALSRLYIANANRNDSGNYTCSLADVAASAVSVHVLRGENPLAMQRGGAASCSDSLLAILAAFVS
ncbi:unnamed protein product [Chrysodeixis includens]|uniref:Ig-like domain-containing protein n=1 Tax=Chrysodeixis includens TaxID=689277 RepID=A0A9N8Q2U8_CHRIL|nr:unnamed protein product [Chrysodeixis includens]